MSNGELAGVILLLDELMILMGVIRSQVLLDSSVGPTPAPEEAIVGRTLLVPRKHRFWVHSIWQKRSELGAYHTLVRELSLDDEKFREFFRLNKVQFGEVLASVECDLSKFCRSREVISARERLAIGIR